MLPQKRKRERSGIERAPRREYPTHRAFVRRHSCSVPGCQDGPIEFAHVRTAANAGTGIKPSDAYGISLCAAHHREQHQIGAATFGAKYKLNLLALAAQFASWTSDKALRLALQER